MRFVVGVFSLCFLCAFPRAQAATVTNVDFEGYFDQTSLTNQYPGLLFSNASIILAGIPAGGTLNEAVAPPGGGVGVGEDCASFVGPDCGAGGPITIDFLTPVSDFSGFFTYFAPLTITGFDLLNHALTPVTSLFSANFVGSGNAPNELLSISHPAGLSRVVISGDPAGGSFVMDDLTITTASTTSATPEPSVDILTGSGLSLILGVLTIVRRKFRRPRPLGLS